MILGPSRKLINNAVIAAAAALNEWLGWDIPWATRDGDSPDVIRKKNIYGAWNDGK